MNGAHLHLMVNHVSLFALSFGLLIFVAQLKFKSRELRLAALALFLVAGAFSAIAVESGESAEKVLTQAVPGTQKDSIEEHEEAAEFAYVCTLAVAALSVGLMIVDRFKPRLAFVAQILLVVFAIAATAAMARTAFLGGKIRHSEISLNSPEVL